MSDVVSYLFENFDPEAGTPRIDLVYVTARLRDELFARFEFEASPGRWRLMADLPLTFVGVPLVVNDEMATVGSREWEPAYRRAPAIAMPLH